ncbi:hypothetical protein BamMEX5DRAFT_2066 [Burkholderia ambifaria MEX-5]|uniref:Uncharacterized protein n=2 Tax=Burkholderia ambifaria TaxID=152480 RepID=B1T2Q0_9BURK|nr:hypothetical protein BamMEX5DRAFT_2066 [Burkholderia ambifaria MEX-5]
MNIFARLQEPSTHAALAGLAGVAANLAVANGADPHVVSAWGTALAGLFGLIGVLLPEKAPVAATGRDGHRAGADYRRERRQSAGRADRRGKAQYRA